MQGPMLESMPHRRRHRGFARIELAVCVALGAAGAALLVVGGAHRRHQAMLAADLGNLHDISALTASYAASNEERVWTFSWKRGQPLPTTFSDLRGFEHSDKQAAANQAVDIMRRRGPVADVPRTTSWVPHLLYSHLTLAEFAGLSTPSLTFVSPFDRFRLEWAQDPERYMAQGFQCQTAHARWINSSSYQLGPAWFDRTTNPTNRVGQAYEHFAWSVPDAADLGGQMFASVAFPSSKVLIHATESPAALHTTPIYFLDESAKVSMLMADGSADARSSGDSNLGWRPALPSDPGPTVVGYMPSCFEAPTSNGALWQEFPGRYRFTRQGLAGRDFGGPEVP